MRSVTGDEAVPAVPAQFHARCTRPVEFMRSQSYRKLKEQENDTFVPVIESIPPKSFVMISMV